MVLSFNRARELMFLAKWDDVMAKLGSLVQKSKDKNLTEFWKESLLVSGDLKGRVASLFVGQCNIRHSLALFEWRLKVQEPNLESA